MTGPTQVLVASAPDHPEALGGALDVLTDEERERIGRFLRPADAASFLRMRNAPARVRAPPWAFRKSSGR